MPLIGTAGHVDHGKSTLIQTLTGRDPDRWAEEKQRGLTIDLGFAWADLGDGVETSFVDVPGHERYLKNMLAGIEAVDMVILVVAANEGWMPQTEEHLAVIDLLGIARGVVALTKTDAVDADTLELARLEIEERLVGTSLQGVKTIPVSSRTKTGFDALRFELARVAASVPAQDGRFRMWIDRVFTVGGAGTVVTGSLLGGGIGIGEEVELFPSGRLSRIRSIQSHERSARWADPGTRVALGLADIGVAETKRGAMVGRVGDWRNSPRFTARIRIARYAIDLPEKGAYQLHFGSATHSVSSLRIEGDHALISISGSVPMAMGDRFVVRDTGRRLVVAGGVVLDPNPRASARALSQARDLDPFAPADDRALQLLSLRGFDTSENLQRDSNGGSVIGGPGAGGYDISDQEMDKLVERANRMVSEEHAERPLRGGVRLATLIEQLETPAPLVEAAISRSERLELVGPDVAQVNHHPTLDRETRARWFAAEELLARSLAVPASKDLELPDEALHLLIRQGELVRISSEIVYLPSQIDSIKERIAGLDPPFLVGDAKEALGLSRKYVIPILEWLDRNHFTIRRDDTRGFGVALTGEDH